MNTPYYERPIPRAIGRWFADAPDGATLPHYVEKFIDEQQRYDAALFNVFSNKHRLTPAELHDLRSAINDECQGWADRVCIEQEVADYVYQVGADNWRNDLRDKARSMYDCHRSGPIGVMPNGTRMIAWNHKCENVRLCPHAAREETQRLAEIYIEGIREWLAESPSRRVQYAVLTVPNYPAGALAEGKRELFTRFSSWRSGIPAIAGALVTQEDPLSARGDWNVHLNVLVMVDGAFDWKAAREAWGANIDFQTVNPGNLMGSVLELVKYATKLTATPSHPEQADWVGDRHDGAPALVQWPHARFLEWYDAQQGFRRTRSYGCLYAIDRRRWNAADAQARYDWLALARTYDETLELNLIYDDWCDFDERTKTLLRSAMRHGERVSLDDVQWFGAVDWDAATRSFSVDLIPGHNFQDWEAIDRQIEPMTPAYLSSPPFQ